MMKQKTIAMTLAATLAMGCALIGCNTASNVQSGSFEEQDSTSVAAESVDEISFDRSLATPAVEKKETVHVEADARGTAKEVTVSAALKQLGDAKFTIDQTNLTEIQNKEGNEQFSQQGIDLLWENKGADITYEGTSTKEPPVGVKVSYYLNGQKMEPEEIAGKSGPVTIRFDYDQSSGTQQPVYVFTTMVLLDHAHFSNVEAKNGVCTSMGDTELISGYVIPKLRDATGLAKLAKSEEINIPEYLEITADATDFQINGTTTLVASGLFKDVSKSNLEEGKDIVKSAQELEHSSTEILNGLVELGQGGSTFKDALEQYTDGALEIDQGTESLSQGISDLESGGGDLSAGAHQLTASLEKLDKALDGVDATALEDFAEQYKEILPTIESTIEELRTTDFDALEQQLLAILDFCEPVYERLKSIAYLVHASVSVLNNLQSDFDVIREEVAHLKDQGADTSTLEALLDAASQKVDNAIGFLSDIDASETELDITSLRQSIEKLHTLASQLNELSETLKPFENLPKYTEAIEKVDNLKKSVSKLANGASQLEEGIELYTGGLSDLSEGARELKNGTSLLGSKGSELNLGYESLAKGIDTLVANYKVFDEQGIQKLGKFASDDLADVFSQMLRLKDLDEHPTSFSGHDSSTSADVKYIVETAGIMS